VLEVGSREDEEIEAGIKGLALAEAGLIELIA
jgi:hypothetical protein